jgi:uncharacterized small protein (DUF1192 family)
MKKRATKKKVIRTIGSGKRGGKFMRNGEVAAHDEKLTGAEPNWEGAETWPIAKFVTERARMFNFYGYYLGANDLQKDLLDFMQRSGKYSRADMSNIKYAPIGMPSTTILKIARALNRGMPAFREDMADYYKNTPGLSFAVAENDEERVHTALKSALRQIVRTDKTNSDTETEKVAGPSLEDRTNEHVISHLDTMLDEWSKGEIKVDKTNVAHLIETSRLPKACVKYIVAWLERHLEELEGALNKTDDQLVEGYSYLRVPAMRNRIAALKEMISEVGATTVKKKAVRVPKPKTPEQLTRNVVVSDKNVVPPTKIVGAKTVVCFNEKYGTIAFIDGTSLSVKGKTIVNISSGFIKKLRKPEDFVPRLSRSNCNIAKLRAEICKLKTVEREHKDNKFRLNENINILYTS